MASICCSPPESLSARFRARSARRGNRASTRATLQRPPARRATSRFSRTVSEGNTRRPWGTMASPAATMRYGGQRVMVSPRKRTAPRRGGVKPMMERTSVVLPTPFRPRMASTSPSPTRSVMPCSTWLAP